MCRRKLLDLVLAAVRHGLLVAQVNGHCWAALNQCRSGGDSPNNQISPGELRLHKLRKLD